MGESRGEKEEPLVNIVFSHSTSALSCTFCFPFGNTSLAIIYADGGSGQYMYKVSLAFTFLHVSPLPFLSFPFLSFPFLFEFHFIY